MIELAIKKQFFSDFLGESVKASIINQL